MWFFQTRVPCEVPKSERWNWEPQDTRAHTYNTANGPDKSSLAQLVELLWSLLYVLPRATREPGAYI